MTIKVPNLTIFFELVPIPIMTLFIVKLATTPGAFSSRKSTIGLMAYSTRAGSLMDEGVSYYFSLAEIEAATNGFSKKIGKGSFGPVYYGKMKDGKEVAVKMMADSSSHGTQQFVTEVAITNRKQHLSII